MIFEFENLGSIKKAELEVGNLTVICGKNNTGKTYLTYAIWGMLESSESIVRVHDALIKLLVKSPLVEDIETQLKSTGQASFNITEYQDYFKKLFFQYFQEKAKNIHIYFDTDEAFFSKTNVIFHEASLKYLHYNSAYNSSFGYSSFYMHRLDENNIQILKYDFSENQKIEKENISFFLYASLRYLFEFPIPFFLSAQRESIHLFANAINGYIIQTFKTIKIGDIIQKKDFKYALPLQANIEYANYWSSGIKSSSLLSIDNSLIKEVENILGIKYLIEDSNLYIQVKNQKIHAYLASTSIRALADLHFYLKYVADANQILMIDEPELSLHPENQIKVARLLVKLVNAGLKVWITTHSDYIIKELNNCLMLSNKKIKGKKKLMKDLGYKDDEVLNPDDLRYYTAVYDKKLEGCTLVRGKVGKYGIDAQSFDETLEKIVETSETIINAIE